MKRRAYAFYDIILNGFNVGNVTVAYHDNLNGNPAFSYVTVEIFFNKALAEIPGVRLRTQGWQTYAEEVINTQEITQAENIARRLINAIILNHVTFDIELHMRRQAFHVWFRNEGRPKFILIHEFYAQPNFKQALVLENSEIRQYSINERDEVIIRDIGEEFS